MKIMNEAEMFKLALKLDEDAKQFDFIEQEDECSNDIIFEELKNAKSNKNCKNLKNNIKSRAKTAKFKEKYFDFYDDVKIPSHKVTDW